MLTLLLVPAALAMATYPSDMQADLGMSCTVTCDVCHSSPGGSGVPTQPFGIAMVARGLTIDSATVAPALDAMVADAVDSDGDGTIDTEALAQGLNPNPTGNDFCPADGSGVVAPSYGCSAVAMTPAAGLLGLAMGLLLVTRRRRSVTAPSGSLRG